MKDCMGFTTEDVVAILRSMKPPTMLRDGKSASHIMQTVAIEYAINAIEERKMGKWERVGKEHTTFFHRRIYRCSACGDFLDFDGVNGGRGDANYCTHCGAKMEVDE